MRRPLLGDMKRPKILDWGQTPFLTKAAKFISICPLRPKNNPAQQNILFDYLVKLNHEIFFHKPYK